MPLFEVAIIKKPTKKEAEDGGMDSVVMQPKAVVAANRDAAILKATKGVEFDPDKSEVLVRDF